MIHGLQHCCLKFFNNIFFHTRPPEHFATRPDSCVTVFMFKIEFKIC